MNINKLFFLFLSLISIKSQSQINEIEDRNIYYYFDQIKELEIKELLKQKILINSTTIDDKFLDSETNQLNNDGFEKYANIKMNIYLTYFKDYLYLQKLEYGNDIYVLYFTMAGYDDMQWDIIKWNKNNWKSEERLSRERAIKDTSIRKILWNYDEADKNLENIRLFIKNDYLVMERGNLYHSLYDLKSEKVILNEESPWNASIEDGNLEMNDWIKKNLHDEIEHYLSAKRE